MCEKYIYSQRVLLHNTSYVQYNICTQTRKMLFNGTRAVQFLRAPTSEILDITHVRCVLLGAHRRPSVSHARYCVAAELLLVNKPPRTSSLHILFVTNYNSVVNHTSFLRSANDTESRRHAVQDDFRGNNLLRTRQDLLGLLKRLNLLRAGRLADLEVL